MTLMPRPEPDDADAAAFWVGIRAGEFLIQCCVACGVLRHPPRPVCAACGSDARTWVASAGRGEVWSFTVIHPPTLPAFMDRTPYGAAVVRLDEGVFTVTTIVDVPPGELTVGERVELAITQVEADTEAEPGLTLPLFRRAR
jgi:uncharacterized OB-fold protein